MNEIKNVLDTSKSVLVVLPKNPYFDQVAAATSLYLGLKNNKITSIYSPNPMLVEFNRLVGVNDVKTSLGANNLVIRFADYNLDNVLKVSCDVESKEMRILVYMQPGAEPPKFDQIVPEYESVVPDAVLLIGGANDSHFPILAQNELAASKILHIGITPLTLSVRSVEESYSRQSSSISEVVFKFLKEMKISLSPDISTNLFAGISDSTRNFTSQSTSSDTFKVAAELLELGARRERAYSQPPQQVQGQQPQQVQNPQTINPNSSLNGASETPPREWMREPKIYKGGSSTN